VQHLRDLFTAIDQNGLKSGRITKNGINFFNLLGRKDLPLLKSNQDLGFVFGMLTDQRRNFNGSGGINLEEFLVYTKHMYYPRLEESLWQQKLAREGPIKAKRFTSTKQWVKEGHANDELRKAAAVAVTTTTTAPKKASSSYVYRRSCYEVRITPHAHHA
jgi:hypothetical protein